MGQLNQSREMNATPYKRLVAAILSGAVQDACGRKISNNPRESKENAINYLQKYDETWHSYIIKVGSRKINAFLERRCNDGEVCSR